MSGEEGGPRRPRIAICGPHNSGKDEAAAWLCERTALTYAGSASRYLLPYVARRLGVSEAEAWAIRHDPAGALEWKDEGDRQRAIDPGVLIRPALADGDLYVGPRAIVELEYGRAHGLIDTVVWISRHVPFDPTLTYGPEACDLVIENHWTLMVYHARLAAFARLCGLKMTGQ